MKTIRLRFVAFFVFGIVLRVFPQSSSVLQIEAADKLYNSRDYANATLSYLKLLNDSSIYKQRVLPYRVQLVNLMKRPEEKKDSTKTDSVKTSQPVAVKNPVTPKPSDSTAKNGSGPKIDLKTKSQYDYVLFQLGQCYRLNADYNNAAIAYKKCVDRGMHPDAKYYYALSLMNVKRYQEALNEFEAYVTSNPSNDSLAKIAQKKEAGCYFAMDSANVNRIIKVTQLDTNVFNKGNSSFAASYYNSPGKMIFTSARKGNVIMDPKKDDPAYLCDLYWTELNDTVWSKAQNFGASLNSNQHEGAGFVSGGEEGGAIFFTRWNDQNPKESFIYKSKMNGSMFYAAQKLNDNVNPMGSRSMQPCLNADGTKLYFSSNRPGGQGGYDIWVCDVDANGIAGAAKNMGTPINTPGDEVTPFIHPVTGSLFYSSNGLPGLGGLDIFKCEYNSNENLFAFPVNMQPPINSSKDDAYFVMDRTQGKGFFSSDRIDCESGNCYKIFEYVNQPIKFDVAGIVFDAQTNEPIANALVSIIETHGNGDPMFIQTNDKGEYFAELRGNSEYFLKAQKNKYLADAGAAVTKEKTKTEHFQQDFFLNTIPKGEIAIEGIEYDFNSAALRPVGMQNLDKIVDLLNLNNNLSVAIEANTDSRGNDAYNMKLSVARAKSCVDYLISKGIAAERLKSKGFGETNPLIKESEINKMKKKSPEWEAAHQKNRRTALKVIGESEIKIINSGQ
jgi:outer membrane protein OmpA-like peptidoglycan-associated protein/tetratricopeptide (TPR) repeat protein